MDLVVAGSVMVASLVPIMRLSKDIVNLESTIREMKGLPIFSPSEVLTILKRGSSLFGKQFQESPDGHTVQGKVFVQGVIDSKYPIESVLDESRQLIYRNFYVQNIYSNERSNELAQISFSGRKKPSRGFLSFGKKKFSGYSITQSAPIMDLYDFNSNTLKQIEQSGIQQNTKFEIQQRNGKLSHADSEISVRIQKNLSASFKNAVQLISQRRHFKKLNLIENTVLVGTFIFEFLCSLLHLRLRGRGIKVGFQEVELGIPVKVLMIVFGELFFDKKTEKMTIPKPEYFFNSKVRLMNDLQNKLANKRILKILLFVPFLFSIGYLYRNFIVLIRALLRKHKRLKEDQLKKMTTLELDDLSCRICKDNVRNIIFKPCHHMTYCNTCYISLKQQQEMECPICKIHITSFVEVFISQSGSFATLNVWMLNHPILFIYLKISLIGYTFVNIIHERKV